MPSERQVCPKPCRECPFRRVSWRGYLGDDTPTAFVEKAEFGVAMPCHLTVDYTSPDWQAAAATAPLCAGALIYLANTCKLPFSADWMQPWLQADVEQVRRALERVQPDHALVFSHRIEFIEHHSPTVKP